VYVKKLNLPEIDQLPPTGLHELPTPIKTQAGALTMHDMKRLAK
jgi:hypothetical protein